MKKDTNITEVIFRKEKDDNEITAIFPYAIGDLAGSVMCYMHVGQHSAGDYDHMIKSTKPANESEYKDLKKELENHYGYNLKVIKKRQYSKYLEAYEIIIKNRG